MREVRMDSSESCGVSTYESVDVSAACRAAGRILIYLISDLSSELLHGVAVPVQAICHEVPFIISVSLFK